MLKKIITFSAGLLFIATVIIALFFSIGPYLFTQYYLPTLLEKHAVNDVEVHFNYITPWTLGGSLEIGPTGQARSRVPNIRISYTPAGIIDKKVSTLTIDGATFYLKEQDGLVSLSGFTPPEPGTPAGDTPELQLPVPISTLQLQNCMIQLETTRLGRVNLLLDGTLEMQYEKENDGVATISAVNFSLHTDGAIQSQLSGQLFLKGQQNQLHVQGELFSIGEVATLLALPPSLYLNGEARFTAKLDLSSDLKTITHFESQCTLPNLLFNSPWVTFKNDSQSPLKLTVNGDPDTIHFTLDHFQTNSPVASSGNFQGTITEKLSILDITGELSLPEFKQPLKVEFKATRNGSNIAATSRIRGPKHHIKLDKETLTTGPFSLHSKYQLDSTTPNQDFSSSHELFLDFAHLDKKQLTLRNVSAKLPITFPMTANTTGLPGKFSIREISYQNHRVARINGTVRQKMAGIAFKGSANSLGALKAKLQFNGESNRHSPLQLSFTLPTTSVDSFAMPAIVPVPDGFTFDARLAAQGEVILGKGFRRGNLKIQLEDGSLEAEEKKLNLSGINSTIVFDLDSTLKSRPSQLLQLEQMDFGNLHFTQGKIFFRIEDPNTIFIEKSSFNWCNGKVESGSLRISKNSSELSTTLYCDRLEFSELLTQLGITETAGDGSLNGRLPLHYNGKELYFDNGFLFSTPGNSGTIRFNNTALLSQGLPNIKQTVYLDYSIRALENFSYNWTKLTFNTQNEELLIAMQIDGKPTNPLPYGYKKGHLVPQTKGAGIQHPLRLDVNFRLPFSELFYYGQNIQQLMEKMQ